MNEAEAQRTYDALLSIVRETKGLAWVSVQVHQLASFGRLEVRQVQTVAGKSDGDGLVLRQAVPVTHAETHRRPRRTAAYTESVQYSGREKLLLLLDAVSRATVGAASIEQEVAALASEGFPVDLAREAMPTAELSFIDESEQESVSTAEGRAAAAEPLKKLQGLIDELRAAADAA